MALGLKCWKCGEVNVYASGQRVRRGCGHCCEDWFCTAEEAPTAEELEEVLLIPVSVIERLLTDPVKIIKQFVEKMQALGDRIWEVVNAERRETAGGRAPDERGG